MLTAVVLMHPFSNHDAECRYVIERERGGFGVRRFLRRFRRRSERGTSTALRFPPIPGPLESPTPTVPEPKSGEGSPHSKTAQRPGGNPRRLARLPFAPIENPPALLAVDDLAA